MTLTLTFWGTRGSVPAPGASTAYYGGNTPCVEVRTSTNALLILAVRKNPLVYDLLYQLNAAFARVHHKMAALTAVGIFDPLMMQNLNRQSEQLRAGANYHLLGAMRRIEERDRERLSQPPNEQTS